MLKSRYNILQVTVIVVFSGLFMLLPFIIYKDSAHTAGLIFLMVLLPLLSAFLLYSFFQKSPRVVFDDIFLSRKESYLGQYVEAAVILFGNQKKLILWQDMYRNLAEMRSFIAQKAAKKIRDAVPDIKGKNLVIITRRRYAGNVYTSFNTLLIIGMIVFFMISLRPLRAEPIFFIPVGFILLLFFGIGTQMNYFVIDDGYLFVRNHYFPWKNKRINLKDIEEVSLLAYPPGTIDKGVLPRVFTVNGFYHFCILEIQKGMTWR